MAAILQEVLPPHTTNIYVISELALSQSVPLICNPHEPYTINNIISNENDEASYKFEQIFESYLSRNSK